MRPKRKPSGDGTVCGCIDYVPDCEQCKLRVHTTEGGDSMAFFSCMSWPVPGSKYDPRMAYSALVHQPAKRREYAVRMLRKAWAIAEARRGAGKDGG